MAEVRIRRLTKVTVGASPHIIVLDAIPTPEVIQWSLIVARCLTSKADAIELLLLRGRTEFLLSSCPPVNKLNCVALCNPVYATGDYRIAARFTDLGVGDIMELYAYGLVQRDFPID